MSYIFTDNKFCNTDEKKCKTPTYRHNFISEKFQGSPSNEFKKADFRKKKSAGQKRKSKSPGVILANFERQYKDEKKPFYNPKIGGSKPRRTDDGQYFSHTSENEVSEKGRHTRDGSNKLMKSFYGHSDRSKMGKSSKEEKKNLKQRLANFRESIQERIKKQFKTQATTASDVSDTGTTPRNVTGFGRKHHASLINQTEMATKPKKKANKKLFEQRFKPES